MVAPDPKSIKRSKARHGSDNTQHLLNRFLWSIVAKNSGRVSLRGIEMKSIPENVALKAEYDKVKDEVVITSHTIPQRGNLILPNNGIIYDN